MTDTPEELKARARRAYERSIADMPDVPHGPADPEQLARLQRALEAMPRRTRNVFLMHRIDRLTYAEIGAATGLSRGQVMRRMVHALYYLTRAMRGEERPPWRRWIDARLSRWF